MGLHRCVNASSVHSFTDDFKPSLGMLDKFGSEEQEQDSNNESGNSECEACLLLPKCQTTTRATTTITIGLAHVKRGGTVSLGFAW